MTKEEERKNFTFRMKKELSEKIATEAESLGISKTAYITMVLHTAMKEENNDKKVV